MYKSSVCLIDKYAHVIYLRPLGPSCNEIVMFQVKRYCAVHAHCPHCHRPEDYNEERDLIRHLSLYKLCIQPYTCVANLCVEQRHPLQKFHYEQDCDIIAFHYF